MSTMQAIRSGPVQALAGLPARAWRTAWLLLPLTALFWSGNAIIGRAVRDAIPPVSLAFWRWVAATVVVLIVAWPRLRRDLPELIRRWPIVLALSFLGIASFNTLFYWGLQTTTAINGVIVQSVMPLIILVFAFFLYNERPTLRQIAGMLLSMVGVAVIVSQGSLNDLMALRINPGDVLIVSAIVLYSLYSALLRRRPVVHPLSFLLTSFAIGAAMLLPLYLWDVARGANITDYAAAGVAVGYTAIFPSFIAYLCFNRGVELIGSAKAGQVVHLMPAIGVLLAIGFLGEHFQLFHAAGIVLIAAGILLAQFKRTAA
jgi:drug/metabolite transporter (DMT)-like permease